MSIMMGLLFEKSTNMIYAWRGTGKTWFSLWLAYALSTGSPFLKWQVGQARRVIYIDGEMPAADLHARLRAIVAANDSKQPDRGYFKLLPADLYELGVPNLAHREGQVAVEAVIGDAKVVFFGRRTDVPQWLSGTRLGGPRLGFEAQRVTHVISACDRIVVGKAMDTKSLRCIWVQPNDQRAIELGVSGPWCMNFPVAIFAAESPRDCHRPKSRCARARAWSRTSWHHRCCCAEGDTGKLHYSSCASLFAGGDRDTSRANILSCSRSDFSATRSTLSSCSLM